MPYAADIAYLGLAKSYSHVVAPVQTLLFANLAPTNVYQRPQIECPERANSFEIEDRGIEMCQ